MRQTELYELGALRDLVRRHASPDLLARADDMDGWIRAPMRALRLETSGPQWPEPVVVTDLRTNDMVEVLDLGVVAERLELAFSHQSETLLTADLPQHSWMTLVGTPLDEAPDRKPDPVVAKALGVALSLAREGRDAAARHRHVISELMLEVSLTDDVCGRFSGSEHLDAWRTLAQVLPPPARARCEAMALWCDIGLPRDIA